MLLNCFLAPEDMQNGQGLLKHEIPWFLGLVFDTGHSVTPLVGHLGCLASHWSVPVNSPGQTKELFLLILTPWSNIDRAIAIS